MLYRINLFEKSFGPARLVCANKKDKGKEQPDQQIESEEEKPALPNIERKKAGVKGKTRELQSELQQDVAEEQEEEIAHEEELDEAARGEVEAKEGTASDYVESFRKFEKTSEFNVLAEYLAQNLDLRGADSEFNYKRWESPRDMQAVADLFEEKFPGEKGKGALLSGLRAKDQKSKEFLKSRNAVGEISKMIDKYVEAKSKTKSDTAANVEKSPGPDFLKDGFQTLSKNFSRGSNVDKALIAGGVIAGVFLIKALLDVQVTKNHKLSDFALWGAGLWGLNYLSGKVAKDGKTLLQRLDITAEIDELKDDNLMKSFMQDIGLRENQETVRTCIKMHDVDLKTLYSAYKDASVGANGKKRINASDIGLREGEIDGEAAYQIAEGLVEKVALNEFDRREKAKRVEAIEKGIPYEKPGQSKKEFVRRNASAIFEDIYINGELGNYPLTFSDAIFQAYRDSDLTKILRKDNESRGTHRAAAAIAGAGTFVWDTGAEYIPKAAGAVWEGAKEKSRIVRDNVFSPMGDYLGPKWDKYWPKAKDAVKELTGWKTVESMGQKADLNKVLPPEFDCNVLEAGKAVIMGMPVKFEITTKDGKDIIIIGGDIVLVIDKGIAGNAKEALKMEIAIKARVDGLVKERAKTFPAIAGKKIEWNASDKKWEIKDVELTGDTRFAFIPSGKTNLNVRIEPNGASIALLVNDKEIPPTGANLNEMYRDSLIQKAIWDDPRYGKLLDKMPVEVTKIETDPALGLVVSGKIAGLGFRAKPGVAGGNQLDFLSNTGTTNPTTGGVEFLQISQSNGGTTFLNEKAKQILMSPSFNTSFMKVEAMMDNTSESLWSRLGGLISDRALWVIPVGLPAAINGKILQRQWKFVVDFKKFEALEMFKQDLQGKTVQDIEKAYKDRIDKVTQQMEKLDRDFHAVRDDSEKAKRFEQFIYGGDSCDGLENANYGNKDYKGLLGEYRKVITDKRFDYEGLESFGDVSGGSGAKSWGAGDKSFEIYQFLLNVWSYNTRDFAIKDRPLAGKIAGNPTENIHPETQKYIRQAVTYKVRAALEICQSNDGKIELEELKTQLKDLMPADWGRSKVVDDYAASVAGGRSTPDESAEIDTKGPIKPEKQNLDRIKRQMSEIFDREFPLRYAPKFRGEVVERYKNILKDLSEGVLLRTITENGSEEEMLSRFSSKLAHIRDVSESSSVLEVWNLIKDLFKWVSGQETWERDLEGENPNVQNSLIKPRNKTLMANSMKKLESYYVSRLEEKHGHLFGNDYNGDMVDFANDVELPFYREFYLNKAILENTAPADLAAKYSEYLKELMRSYIKDPAKRTAQIPEDAAETAQRIRQYEWTSTRDEMEQIIR